MKVHINLKRTGENLKKLTKAAGYEAKDIQQYLELSCPQPVYRWFKGKMLPSVDHLLALAILLDCHVDDLLIVENNTNDPGNAPEIEFDFIPDFISFLRRLLKYRKLLAARGFIGLPVTE